jgi:signal transduction histidine kinase
MKLFASLQRRLAWKLFISYLLVVAVGVVVLAGTAELQAPAVLSRHAARMQTLAGDNAVLTADLYQSFAVAVNEVLAVSAAAATLAAVVISIFTAGRIVGPIQVMMRASQSIAVGNHHGRVEVPSQDELGALAESFNRMAATLEQTESRRMELIGDVAHELRTPLASIRSTMEGLVDGVLPAEAETFLGVEHELARLQRLVQDLQELSRAEAGQIPLDLRPVALSEVIQRVTERLASQFEDKGVTLQADVPIDLPAVQADANRTAQVLVNLLGNALQYTPTGGRVSVRAEVEGRSARLSVQDTGIGVTAEHLPHLFERFYRVDRSRSRAGGGSGIGLTIARHLIEAEGGRLRAESSGIGQGSTFTFTLPLAS